MILGVKILVDQFLDDRILCLEILGSMLTRILASEDMTVLAKNIPISGAKVPRLSTYLLLMSQRQKGIKLVAAGTVQFPFLQLGGKVENFLVVEMLNDVLEQRPEKKNDVNNLPERPHVPELSLIHI